jgi:superfamily II DNA or RNA helicase
MPYEERPYQTGALAADLKEFDAGVHRIMNVMATGVGKTITFAKLREKFKSRLPGQMLVLAHTDELVTQNLEKIQEENPDLKVEKEMAGAYADTVGTDIFSASVATLGRAGTKRIERFNWDNIDKIVVDEAHHSTQESYGRVLAAAGVAVPDTHKLLLGVTATSERPDGRALSDVFDKVAYVYTLRQAIEDKWLVPIRGFRVATDTSLGDVSVHNGDFVRSELQQAVNSPERNKRVVDSWLKLGENRQTVVFTVDIDHAEKMAEEFRAAGVKAEAVWGDDPDREKKLERHQNGETRVLCNCNTVVEGYDDPTISCIVLAAPTQSGLRYTQMVGRGTRLNEGKIDLIVIDMVDNTVHNTLVTLPTLMGLSNMLDLKGKDLLWVVEQIEALQADNPTIDFGKMKSVDELKTIVQTVNMFEVRFPKEVEENSTLQWYRAVEGGYKILIPKDGPEKAGFMRLYENQLGQWDITGRIKDVNLAAVRPSMEEAFKASDEQIRKRLGTMRLSYLLREATWHGKPVSKGQIKMLERLFPKRLFPLHMMTSGQASKIISERLARKVTQ